LTKKTATSHPEKEGVPSFRAPTFSCNSHFHVFGPTERYPYGADLRYKPPLAPLEDYLALARHLGCERFVFMQPSAYGRNNACMLGTMREMGAAKCRGIVDVDESAPDAELEKMSAAGVRGVWVNVNPIKPPEPGFSKSMLPRIERLDARCATLSRLGG
jgi:predicted TIM-barrel fold metal-dependent hydrolase